MPKIVGFVISSSFNNSAVNYAKLIQTLTEKGFQKRQHEFGFLVPTGQSITQLDVQEQKRREYESDLEHTSMIGKYCIVSRIPQDFDGQIIINYSPNFPTQYTNSNILEEVRNIINVMKTCGIGITKSKLIINVEVNKITFDLNNFKNPNQISSITDMIEDVEMTRYYSDVYLYSRQIDVTNGGDIAIVEDIQRKNLQQYDVSQRNGWEMIKLMPRNNTCVVGMEYKNGTTDEIFKIFVTIEERVFKLIHEIKNTG